MPLLAPRLRIIFIRSRRFTPKVPLPQLAPGMHPLHPPNPYTRPAAERRGGVVGYKAVALTDGVYIAAGSPALTDEPLWVNVSEPGTWGA